MTASPSTAGALGIVRIGTAEQRRIAAALTRLGWQAGWENAAATLGRHPKAHERGRKVPSAREVPATQALCALGTVAGGGLLGAIPKTVIRWHRNKGRLRGHRVTSNA